MAKTKAKRPPGLTPDLWDAKPSKIFIVQEEVDTTDNQAVHEFFKAEEKKSAVVEEIGKNKYKWNDMTVEVEELVMETSKENPKVYLYRQVLNAMKENGDALRITTKANSYFGFEPGVRKHGLSICGEGAEANWHILANIDGKETEYEEERKTNASNRGTSAAFLLDGDPRVSSYCLKPLASNNIVAIKQIYGSFEKIEEYMTDGKE